MSGRIKRHLSKAGSSTSDLIASQSSSSLSRKKRKVEANSSEDEERSFWTPKHLGDLKAYNRSATETPAELFRKDLISAMKLADNEPLTDDDFWGISDQWKQEWEKGVQVPVNPDSLPEPSVIHHRDYPKPPGDFRLPRRYIRVTHNDFFNNEKHVLSNVPTKAEKMCRYDMDNLDDAWLIAYNGERARMGAEPVPLHTFELIIEHFEEMCSENIHKLLKTEESLSLEFDEDVICDVCRSLDSEEGNEMVFCDTCNICVHQACYGITAIPSGSWLCRTCSLGIKPNCVLCPNKGGAMKSTKTGHKWAHVACALWIPEVSIGSVERMEPITKIATIPHSRWALVCVLCRERWGACIQCSVKSCKIAYHVTCAFKHGLEMKAIIEDENPDDVKLRSYCEKHSRINKKDSDGDSDGGTNTHNKKKKDPTNEQKNQAKAAQRRKIEAEFYKHVDFMQTSTVLDIDEETVETIFNYWKLKRKSLFNKSLLTPRSQELDLLAAQQEQDIERMKMFVQLRQYLERVRNLCYMVSRREKMSRTLFKTREQTFLKQASLLSNPKFCPSSHEKDAVLQANHGPSIYDRMYSHLDAPVHTIKQYEKFLKHITGSYKSKAKIKEVEEDIKEKTKKKYVKDVNGVIRKKHSRNHSPIPPPNQHHHIHHAPHPLEIFKENNPYKRTYFNGAEQRRSRSKSHGSTDSSSAEDSDSSLASTKWKPPEPGNRLSVYTSSEDERFFNKKGSSNTAKSFSSTFDFNSFKVEVDSSEEEDIKTKSIDANRSLPSRGRGGRRGRGRPPSNKGNKAGLTPTKEKLYSSEEEIISKKISPIKDSKAFDALIKNTPKSYHPDTLSIKLENERKPSVFSSEDESPKNTKRSRRKLPVKKEIAVSSSDDEVLPPPKPTPSPPKRGRKGKGRGRSRGSTRQLSILDNISNKMSDDDLPPPTYKLTSDEDDKSDRSLRNEPRIHRQDASGANSEQTENSASEQEITPRKEKRKQARSSKGSDSEAASETSLKDNPCDSFNPSHMKTKAAMKEFTPKLEAKLERISKKEKIDKTSSKLSKRIPDKVKTDHFDSSSKESNNKVSEAEPLLDLAFVPQRAAAKKASELITSQNTGAIAPVATQQAPSQDVPEVKKLSKVIKESVSETESVQSSTEEHRKSPIKSRKKSKEKVDESKGETSDPPKKNIFETPDILPYVPMREAARKAAENFKAGSIKTNLPQTSLVPEDVDSSSPSKVKKPSKSESKISILQSSKLKSPRSSTKSASIASDSETEHESYSPSSKRGQKEVIDIKGEKSRSIFSESEDEGLLTPQKEPPPPVPEKVEQGKDLPHKQQLFRGDIFIFNHQSSSDDEEDKQGTGEQKSISGKASANKEDYHKSAKKQKHQEGRGHSFRNSRSHSKTFVPRQSEEEEHEAENEEPATETRRKAPDKKLKTSDGRPEHGFQPPLTKRNESRVTPCGQPDEIPYSLLPSSKRSESALCESGPECRSRNAISDVGTKDLPSDSDASPQSKEQRGKETQNASPSKNKYLDSRKHKESPKQELPLRVTRNAEKERGKIQFEENLRSPKLPPTSKTSPEKGFKSTFECISTGQEKEAVALQPHNKNACGSIFNFNDRDVEVNRLDDIEEADPEPGPKNVKIFDSDEENTFPQIEGKVEQPKDSGYKSAIATPEPNEKIQLLAPDNDIKPCIMTSQSEPNEPIPTPKKIQPHISPLEGTNISNKYISPGRRKNLEDIIDERKKFAEQSELTNSFEKSANPPLQMPSPHHRSSLDSLHPDSVDEPVIKEAQSDSDGSVDTGTSRFVERWRGQWVKSPQNTSVPMEHNELPPANFPSQPTHHVSIPGLDYQRYLESIQQNAFQDNFHQGLYFQHVLHSQRMMDLYRYASLRQDNLQLHNEQPIRMPTQEQSQRLKVPPPSHLANSPCQLPNRNAHMLPEETPPHCKGLNLPPNSESTISDLASPASTAKLDLPPTSIPPLSVNSLLHKAGSLPSDVDQNKDSDFLSGKNSQASTPTSHSNTNFLSSLKIEQDTSSPIQSQSIETSLPFTTNSREEPSIVPEISTALSQNSTPTSTITTTSSKISILPIVSSSTAPSSPAKKHSSPARVDSTLPVSSVISIPYSSSLLTTSSSSPLSTCKVTASNSVSSITSPISSIISPSSTPKEGISPRNTSQGKVLRTPEHHTKRIPIYMQEPKTPKPEKRSPRSQNMSPRWTKEKREKKPKSSRKFKAAKSARGRGGGKGRNKGGYNSPRFSSASVPKELVGTVYEFDDDFDDDGPPANNTLNDLKMLREKRTSVDTTPQQNFTPTYSFDKEPLPPKKSGRERKSKAKEKQPKIEKHDEVAKILEDYKKNQNSTLKRSVHEPSPPQIDPYSDQKLEASIESPTSDPLALDEEKDHPGNSSNLADDARKAYEPAVSSDNPKDGSDSTAFTPATRFPDDGTNQLRRLKLKGPYANNYLHNNLSTSQPEVTINPAPPSTTTTLRRMRKKELIMQYCYQDKTPSDIPEKNFNANAHNPIKTLGITIPKAVASMTTIPTREDYKMYTQDGSNSKLGGSTNRRRRQMREMKSGDWTVIDEGKGKRPSENSQDSGRKRARGSKDTGKTDEDKYSNLSPGKLRISIGKKVPEVVTPVIPQSDVKDLGSKGKPPKKRFPEDTMFMKIKNESLKYREEVMANFDKRSSENSKSGAINEKKSKRRKVAHSGDGNSSASEIGEDSQDVKVISNESSHHKLVIKISKGKSDRSSSDGRSSGKEDRPGSVESNSNPHPYPLKLRLSLSRSKSDSNESTSANPTASDDKKEEEGPSEKEENSKVMPLKLTFKRGPKGSYRSSRNEMQMLLDQGPGPPDSSLQPQPPDPTKNPGLHPPYKDDPPPPVKDPPVDTSQPQTSSQIEHRDREALTREEPLQDPLSTDRNSPPTHSSIPKDVFERLEAHLAAADGGVSFSLSQSPPYPHSSSSLNGAPTNPPSFSALQSVPGLKDDSGCR